MSLEVKIEHLGAHQFEIRARNHTVISDQPVENGGHDEGMTPPELMLASIGSCAGFYAAEYLRKNDLATEGTRVRVSAEKVKGPARLENIGIAIDLPAQLSEPHQQGVAAAVRRCLIHNTLTHPPKMSVDIHCPAGHRDLADAA